MRFPVLASFQFWNTWVFMVLMKVLIFDCFFHTNYIEGHLVFSPLITRDSIMSIGSNSMNFKFKLLERVNVRE